MFQDEYPLLVASVESLDFVKAQLNAALNDKAGGDGAGGRQITGIDATKWNNPASLSIARFRPNVVLKGVGKAFSEDSWNATGSSPHTTLTCLQPKSTTRRDTVRCFSS